MKTSRSRDAYHRVGIRSKKLGIPRHLNPYAEGTVQHAHWRAGWDSVKNATLEKVFDKQNKTGSI